MAGKTQRFSLVVPVLNEEAVLRDTYSTLTEILEQLDLSYEVIAVDNGSTDATSALMHEICAEDSRWRYIRLSRNFGYQNSISAGMLAAEGDAIMVIDADLQDPPTLIPEFIAKWREGYDVVYGVRHKRVGESRLRVIPTMLAMNLITWMSDTVKLPVHSGDFRLISRRARDAFAQMSESCRYVRGMIHWLGFKQMGIPYVRRGRNKGYSKVNPLFLLDLLGEAIVNFSYKPVRFFSVLGAGTISLTILTFVVWLVSWLAGVSGVPHAVGLLLALNLGVTALGIGVLGEYLVRVFTESKRRPTWLIDYTLNLHPANLPVPAGLSSHGGHQGSPTENNHRTNMPILEMAGAWDGWDRRAA